MMVTINKRSEGGMTLFAVLAAMSIFAISLLAVAPTIMVEVQRERELESIRRGEEVANAIKEYVTYYQGAKLPNSIDDLLEGLPNGTKKRQILRASAATDPLSEDGKWRLIKPDIAGIGPFAKRVQAFNNGLLPSNPSQLFDRYSLVIVNSVNSETDSDNTEPDDGEIEILTENTPFIGVASQSRARSVIAYYGIENHSKWLFTPLFRGTGSTNVRPGRGQGQRPERTNLTLDR